ncbi:MAG: C-terminal target protein, partial [Chitinophagaceae bacterium]|nr:C-terminal target protein [Chitinophagaceae bacterium]
MKKVLLSLFVLQSSLFFSHAATITWTGPSGSNWNNIANWSPGTVPGAADDVIFNVSVTVEMDPIPATNPFIYLINSLLVTGNASVILSRTQPGGGTRILQVKSTNAATSGLRIDNGSTLTINAANTTGTLSYILDLAGAAAVTAQISGNLYFTGSGAGTGDAHLNIYTGVANYAKLSVKNTGVIKYFPNSGNTLSAPGSYLTMESGSVYEINKNGGSVPAGNWDDNSTISISGATTNGGIIFSQNQYGNLEWNTPLMSAVTQMIATFSTVTAISLNHLKITNTNGRELRLKTGAASASPSYEYTVRGNLEITGAGIFVITGINVVNAGAGARLHVMGNLTNAGILKSEGATGTVNDLELNGSLNQDISIAGTLSGTQLKFIMNNLAGATLITPLILPGITSEALQLNNGKIKTTATRMLSMLDNSGYTGGTATSFIEGPMKKIGDDAFSFPVGKGGIYAPIKFSPS